MRAKAPGRGAWIGVTRAELETALAKGKLKGALARAFKSAAFTHPADLPARIAAALERNALDRLGLEARAGHAADRRPSGSRPRRASGKLHALYHAADAGADGAGKLAQAWRVGSDAKDRDCKGLALPVTRTILSLALGRENVVHIGVTDRAAAQAGERSARPLAAFHRTRPSLPRLAKRPRKAHRRPGRFRRATHRP